VYRLTMTVDPRANDAPPQRSKVQAPSTSIGLAGPEARIIVAEAAWRRRNHPIRVRVLAQRAE
jgi:hypothetical protein